MAWNIHFNGESIGPYTDAEITKITNGVKSSTRVSGGLIIEGTNGEGTKTTFYWTPGAPISFEHLAED